ncbi:MAG TPA: hypothetical protein VN366_00265 [Feifaniaceae bacterium]|nr:hypothetical protein [Feifaniaceae bacterium]
MDYTYYLFAFFVFVLVCATVYLSSMLRRNQKEEAVKPPPPDDFREREEELLTLFHKLERAMSVMQEDVEETRAEVRADREEVASMLERMQHLTAGIRVSAEQRTDEPVKRGRGRPRTARAPQEAERSAPASDRKKSGPKKKSLRDRVLELYDAGIPADRIAQELSISLGEVDLALGIQQEKSI